MIPVSMLFVLVSIIVHFLFSQGLPVNNEMVTLNIKSKPYCFTHWFERCQLFKDADGDLHCSGSWPRPWRAEHQVEQSSGCTWTGPSPSQTSTCIISAIQRKRKWGEFQKNNLPRAGKVTQGGKTVVSF